MTRTAKSRQTHQHTVYYGLYWLWKVFPPDRYLFELDISSIWICFPPHFSLKDRSYKRVWATRVSNGDGGGRHTSTEEAADGLCYANFTLGNDFQDPDGNRKPFD